MITQITETHYNVETNSHREEVIQHLADCVEKRRER